MPWWIMVAAGLALIAGRYGRRSPQLGSDGVERFEPPKYITSLIASVNDGAKSAQTGALAFSFVGPYLLANAFSVSDEDMLLGRSVQISQLGAQVPVTFTFAIAPVVFLFLHIYTLIRYDMLATNLRHFRDKLRAMVPLEADRESCRQLLANVEFAQWLVAPKASPLRSVFFGLVARLVIAVFPVTVLLLVQVSSLRLQSDAIIWVQRGCLILDLTALVWFFNRQRSASHPRPHWLRDAAAGPLCCRFPSCFWRLTLST